MRLSLWVDSQLPQLRSQAFGALMLVCAAEAFLVSRRMAPFHSCNLGVFRLSARTNAAKMIGYGSPPSCLAGADEPAAAFPKHR